MMTSYPVTPKEHDPTPEGLNAKQRKRHRRKRRRLFQKRVDKKRKAARGGGDPVRVQHGLDPQGNNLRDENSQRLGNLNQGPRSANRRRADSRPQDYEQHDFSDDKFDSPIFKARDVESFARQSETRESRKLSQEKARSPVSSPELSAAAGAGRHPLPQKNARRSSNRAKRRKKSRKDRTKPSAASATIGGEQKRSLAAYCEDNLDFVESKRPRQGSRHRASADYDSQSEDTGGFDHGDDDFQDDDFKNDNSQNVKSNGHDSPAADSASNQGLDENPNPNDGNPEGEIWWEDEIHQWLVLGQKAEATQKRYRRVVYFLITYLKEHFPDTKDISKVELRHLQEWKLQLGEQLKAHYTTSDPEDPGEYSMSNATERKFVIVVKSLWKSICLQNPRLVNCASGLRLPLADMSEPKNRFSTPEEVQKFLDRAKNKGMVDVCVFGLLYYTGVRVHELCQLKKKQVKMKEDENGNRSIKLRKLKGKGRKYRSVPVSSNGVAYLWDWLKHFKQRKHGNEENKYLFPERNPTGTGHRSTDSVYRMVKRYAEHLKMEKFTPHVFRHAFATHNYKDGKGVSIKNISKWLGHSDIRTTQMYLQTDPIEQPKN